MFNNNAANTLGSTRFPFRAGAPSVTVILFRSLLTYEAIVSWDLRHVWLGCLNNNFCCLNNTICIFIIFFYPNVFLQYFFIYNITRIILPNRLLEVLVIVEQKRMELCRCLVVGYCNLEFKGRVGECRLLKKWAYH